MSLLLPFRGVLSKRANVYSVVRCIQLWSSDNVVRSPYQDVEIPELTLANYMWSGLDKWATKTAMVCGITDRGYTYEQMYKLTRTFAANLRKKFKIQDGDVVGVLSPNIPEYAIITLGILEAGGVATTLNPVYTAYEIKSQIELSGAKILIVHADIVNVAKEALRLAKKDIPIITIHFNTALPEKTISFQELIDDKHVNLDILREVNRKPDDVTFLPYSSGTTGLPKGVELTNRNIVVNCEQQNGETLLIEPTTENGQSSALAILPLFHSYGLTIGMLHKLSLGLKVVTLPKFQPDTFLEALIKYRITILHAAPPMILFLGSSPNATPKHFEYLKVLFSGAAPLAMADVEKVFTKAGSNIVNFYQGYGMTEASPLVTLCPKGCKRYDSVGLAIPNVELRVVDSEMNNLGPGQVGELLIRGPNIMKGYKNNPEANKEALIEGGWYRSGDIVTIDESGFLYVQDRLKDLIKVKGYQVPPAELESVLKEHPSVHDAAVVGVPDPISGEKPKAFIVAMPNAQVNLEEVKEFVAKRVAPYKRINDVTIVDSIPKNASGKILRRVLK